MKTTGRTEERNTAAPAARFSGCQTSGSVAPWLLLLGVALPSGHVPQTKAHRCIRVLRAPNDGDHDQQELKWQRQKGETAKCREKSLRQGGFECVVLTRDRLFEDRTPHRAHHRRIFFLVSRTFDHPTHTRWLKGPHGSSELHVVVRVILKSHSIVSCPIVISWICLATRLAVLMCW